MKLSRENLSLMIIVGVWLTVFLYVWMVSKPDGVDKTRFQLFFAKKKQKTKFLCFHHVTYTLRKGQMAVLVPQLDCDICKVPKK